MQLKAIGIQPQMGGIFVVWKIRYSKIVRGNTQKKEILFFGRNRIWHLKEQNFRL
jgi:hypothetical protein